MNGQNRKFFFLIFNFFSNSISSLSSASTFYSKLKLNWKKNWKWGRRIFAFDQSTVIFDGQLKKNLTWYSLEKKIFIRYFLAKLFLLGIFWKKNFIRYFLTIFSFINLEFLFVWEGQIQKVFKKLYEMWWYLLQLKHRWIITYILFHFIIFVTFYILWHLICYFVIYIVNYA